MATVGGDWLEIRVVHPTLGQHVFYPKSNEGNTFDPGGIRTNDDGNQVTGSGQPIWQKNNKLGSFEVVVANDMNVRQDAIFAKKLTASPVEGQYTLSHVNGSIWGVSGMPVGDIAPDTNAATFTLKIAFGGEPNKIA